VRLAFSRTQVRLMRATAFGKTEEEVKKELGSSASEALIKSKIFEGNKPTNSILFDELTPATLGASVTRL
jgi:glucose-6-phosphate isomerase